MSRPPAWPPGASGAAAAVAHHGWWTRTSTGETRSWPLEAETPQDTDITIETGVTTSASGGSADASEGPLEDVEAAPPPELVAELEARLARAERALAERDAELGALRAHLAPLTEQLRALATRDAARLEEELLELATCIAEAVLMHALAADPARMRRLVEEGLRQTLGEASHRLRVGQETARLLSAGDTAPAGLGARGLEIVVDEAAEPLSCVVERAGGEVELSPVARLAALRQGLADRWRELHGEGGTT